MLSFLTEDLRLTSDISKSSTCFSDLVILLSNPKSAPKLEELLGRFDVSAKVRLVR